MKAELISEYLKLRTVRSSTVLAVLAALLVAVVAFFAFGYKASAGGLSDDAYLYETAIFSVTMVSFFPALITLLQVTHEYRYHTILHTFTATRSRFKVLTAKWLVASAYAAAVSLLVVVIAIGAALLGVQLQGNDLAPQSLELAKLLGIVLLYSTASVTIASLIAHLIRNQVAAIVFILVWPGFIEGILALVLNEKIKYLPFQALDALAGSTVLGSMSQTLTLGSAVLVVLGYVAAGSIALAVLINRRDVN